MGFSFYVENFANYSIIYGTLGAVIILMMWLYMTSLILILGAELNSAEKLFGTEERMKKKLFRNRGFANNLKITYESSGIALDNQ